jgi:hypothetical protein
MAELFTVVFYGLKIWLQNCAARCCALQKLNDRITQRPQGCAITADMETILRGIWIRIFDQLL